MPDQSIEISEVKDGFVVNGLKAGNIFIPYNLVRFMKSQSKSGMLYPYRLKLIKAESTVKDYSEYEVIEESTLPLGPPGTI